MRASVLYLVLQGAVLSFGLFADDDQIQVVVASAVARQAVDVDHISKQVQFTPVKINRVVELQKNNNTLIHP